MLAQCPVSRASSSHTAALHAGMLPLYLKHRYQRHGAFEPATALLAIHNLAHQGTSLASTFDRLNLPPEVYHELEWIYTEADGRQTPVRAAASLACAMLVLVLARVCHDPHHSGAT